MLFNSYEFLFVFLPIAIAVFFLLGGRGYRTAASVWLAVASVGFYAYWNPYHVPLVLGSIVVNYLIGDRITRTGSRSLLWAGVTGNLLLLGVCKYRGFAVENLNALFGLDWPVPSQILPLGVSFFTFTQIAFLVDAYRGGVAHYPGVRYGLFVLFFPHLIAGPIVHHHQLIPQLGRPDIFKFQSGPFATGLTLFTIGFAKKVIFADTLARFARPVFGGAEMAVPTLVEAWVGALSYTLQLYFDFSGYSDMALGLARMFNVKFPANFNSPYKAASIVDFWRRWHITLSNFLRDYLYFPLGGSRCGVVRRYGNLFITMLLGGIWHGAGWTFVIWGAWHGLCLCINHGWRAIHGEPRKGPVSHVTGVAITFLCVVVGWVFFRAANVDAALRMLHGMAGLGGVSLSAIGEHSQALAWIGLLLLVAWFAPNSQQIMADHEPALGDTKPGAFRWSPSGRWAFAVAVVFVIAVLHMSLATEFIYFQVLKSPARYLWIFAAGALAALAGVAVLNFRMDPLQHYRPAPYPALLVDLSRFRLPGLARHHTQPALIAGTSVSRTQLPADVKEVFGMDALNLAMEGASAREQYLLLRLALKTGKVKVVIWDVNYEYLRGGPEWVSSFDGAFPAFLYDENFTNDIPGYLLGLDTTKNSLKVAAKSAGLPAYKARQPEEFQKFAEGRKFGPDAVAKSLQMRQRRAADFRALAPMFDPAKVRASFEANYLALAREFPGVQFELYFPPFSKSYFDFLRGHAPALLDACIAARAAVFTATRGCANVRLHDFQSDAALIGDPNHYCDIIHYDAAYNRRILEAIKAGSHEASAEQMALFEKKVREP